MKHHMLVRTDSITVDPQIYKGSPSPQLVAFFHLPLSLLVRPHHFSLRPPKSAINYKQECDRVAKMHPAESYLRTILTHDGYYEIACALMALMSASDVSALFAALHLRPSTVIRQNFLHPLRDIDHTMQAFKSWMQDRCQILIIGPDSRALVERILDPNDYYGRNDWKSTQLVVWVVAIPPNFRIYTKRVSKLCRIWKDTRKQLQERRKAFWKHLDLFDRCIMRQYSQPLLKEGKQEISDVDTVHGDTIHGDHVEVKVLGPLCMSDCMKSSVLGLDFEGLRFFLPWDMGTTKSGRKHWNATDGIPYIDVADPFYVQAGELDTSMRSDDDKRRIGGESLVFYCDAPERTTDSTVSIAVKHRFPECM